jgi:hypothetical protein
MAATTGPVETAIRVNASTSRVAECEPSFATLATLALPSVRSHAHPDQHARSVRSSSQSISSSATVRLCG